MQKVVALLTLACTHSLTTHAQYCIESRFTQGDYFSDEQINVNTYISYGLAEHWFLDYPQPDLNTFDIAYPEKSLDPLEKKPLILLAHGGGFWGGEKEEFSYHIEQLAKNGYVAVSMNYRKGWDGDPVGCDGDPLSLSRAIYFGMQDAKACLRYLINHAEDYGIDTSAIFVGGESAGAYAMLNSIYLSNEEWDNLHPGFESQYGDLDHAVNDLEENYSVKGFISMWGGVLDTALCTPDELKPTISFYGTSDDIIPPYDGYVQYCENYEHVNGGAGLAIHLSNYEVPNVLHEHLLYGHEAYEETYTTGNIACFVKSVLCGEVQTRTVQYEEANCEDMVLTVDDIESNVLNVYPNPAADYLVIKLTELFLNDPAVQVFDLNGRLQAVQFTTSGNSVTLNISELPAGMYQIQISKNGLSVPGKFVVSRFK